MSKFKGVLMSDMQGQDKIGFADLIAAKSSPIEHIYLAETARNTYYYIPRPNYTFGEFWIDNLVKSLAVAKDSLEHLYIDMYYPNNHYTLDWFGGLTNYTKLRTLHLRLRDLLHIDFPEGGISQDFPTFITLPDMLPASLERIYVSDFDFPHLTGLRELQNLVSAKDRFPHLRVIDIEAYLEFEEICSLSCNLRRACEEASIEFNVYNYKAEVEHHDKPECESKDHWSHQLGNILEF
ncbi:hypothetical protein N8T08_002486 [Aspergillus melleus]|uniref:Uncharacterized protein n=1 Tax=Aspergillus melleus TaxID=138277 RepID=A0ACC3ALU3_9EURO|nr:hypothetical protein N8T08_002486 [Aspergillus melleus]